MIGAVRELDCLSAHIRLREPDKSEDKSEGGSTDREGRDADARQRIVGPWAWQHHGTQRRDFRGVIDPLLSWRENIDRKRGRGGGECKGKLQVQSQRRPKLSKTYSKLGVSKWG
ncbi:hypothetical protein BHM03_00055805 [Ensete ventricosum]|nr:hypothetical protein BHM03_00055805 [Ensete ventricosum]